MVTGCRLDKNSLTKKAIWPAICMFKKRKEKIASLVSIIKTTKYTV